MRAHAMTTQCNAGIGTPVSPGTLVGPGRFSFAPKDAGRVACGSHKTLWALGWWFGFELDEIFSGLVVSAGSKLSSLISPVDIGHHYSTYQDPYGSVKPYRTGKYLVGPPVPLGCAYRDKAVAGQKPPQNWVICYPYVTQS